MTSKTLLIVVVHCASGNDSECYQRWRTSRQGNWIDIWHSCNLCNAGFFSFSMETDGLISLLMSNQMIVLLDSAYTLNSYGVFNCFQFRNVILTRICPIYKVDFLLHIQNVASIVIFQFCIFPIDHKIHFKFLL